MSKTKISRRSVEATRVALKNMYSNKYYNLFMNSVKWTGLKPQQENYVMRKFWSSGTVAAFKFPLIDDMLGFAPYATQSYNMYDFPEELRLINERNIKGIPSQTLINNKNAVIGFINENHKGVCAIVDTYINKIVEVEMVINTNLQTHKMPFMVGITPNDIQKANDIMDKLMNDETVIFMDSDDLALIKSYATNTPYIIDKLYQYKVSLENELLTYLGIDNNSAAKKERMLVDEVNANNALINAYSRGTIECLTDWCEEIKEYLGITISVESTLQQVESVYESSGTENKGMNADNRGGNNA